MAPILDCHITPGTLAVIVVVVVASVVLAYFIGTACVRAWIKKSPTYVYCARCNQFVGSLNVGRPPHLVPGFQVPPHLVPGFQVPSYNNFHDVPNIRVNVSKHDDRPPTGTFQRLGMRTSKSNRSSTFPNFLSPIQGSPPDKITTTSEMELLTPMSKYVNHPGAVGAVQTPNDPSSVTRVGSLVKKTHQRSGKVGPPLASATGRTVNTEMLSQVGLETGGVSGDDSVFYQEEEHRREVSKMSQVRILASPPPVGASKLHGALITKTPANANKSHRNVEASSCGPSKIKNGIRSSLRDEGQARRSVESEGSGKSRRSLMSRKVKLFSYDRKPRNSRDTQYSPLVNQKPNTTEDSCGIGGDYSGEDRTFPNRDSISNNGDTGKNALVEKPLKQLEINAQEGQDINHSFIQEGNVLKTDSLGYPNELKSNNEMTIAGNKITESEAKNVAKLGSPGNTGDISNLLVDIDMDGSPPSISPASKIRPQIDGDGHCEAGARHSCEADDGERLVQNEMCKDGHVIKNAAPAGQDLGTKLKIRSSSSARKEKAQYLGKRPGFTESDITSQSEDERPRTRIASLRRSHLAGMSQSEEDELTNRKQRDNQLPLDTPSHTPQFPVQNSKYVTAKRGTPTPSSLPICTPKFVTVRDRNNAPDTSNYPSNSWDSKNNSNFPPNSWDPASQDFVKSKPFDLSASSRQVNLSINSCMNNLSGTAMDNSTPAEGNHSGTAMDNSTPAEGNHSVTAMDNSTPAEGNHSATAMDNSTPAEGNHSATAMDNSTPAEGNHSATAMDNSTPAEGNHSATAMDNSTPAEGNHTSSPHSSAHLAAFKPEDLSIPGLDTSLSESSPPLVQDGRYSQPLHNPMRQHLGLPSTTQNQSSKVLTPLGKSAEKIESNNSPSNLPNLDNSTGSFSSQNQLLKLNHDSSKGSQDTIRGVSLDSTSTLVPSPVSFNNRPQPQAFPTHIPLVSKSSPSPQHSLIPRPIERNHQTRSMPPATQWSRVQEHALPPSLPPLAPKPRIDVVLPTKKPGQSLQSPAQNMQQSESGTHMPNMRSMPPAPQWSRVKEHALPPSLPPQASKSRILSSELTNNSHGNIKPTPTNTGSNYVTDSPVDMLLPPLRSLPPPPHWPRVPPFLPPSHDALIQVASLPPVPPWPRVNIHPLPPSLPPSHHELIQQLRTLPPVPQWPLPPYLPPTAARTRIPGFGIQRNFERDDRDCRMGVVPKERNGSASDIGTRNSRSSSASSLPMYNDNPRRADSSDRRYPLVGGTGGPPATAGPVGPIILQPSSSGLVAGQHNSQVNSRSRSTTESSHPPSLMWDSYGSDPSFVPRRPEDLEDFTLSSESESNKMMRKEQNMVYRSDGGKCTEQRHAGGWH